MTVNNCLFGPAFSINGNASFSDKGANFQAVFNSSSDQGKVLTYQWYLNGMLVIDQSSINFNDKISCGTHELGLRILTAEGWSGIKSIPFTTCKTRTSVTLYGATSVDAGSSTQYEVLQFFSDGSHQNISAHYTFSASAAGSFTKNTFLASKDPNHIVDEEITISATKTGAETLTKQVMIRNIKPVTLLSAEISGPANLDQGDQARYAVIGHYSDGSQKDISQDFVLVASEGYFRGQTYVASLNGIANEVRGVSITAMKNGFVQVSRQINVHIDQMKSGVLMVDFYNDPSMNLVAMIDTQVFSGYRIPAHQGANIIPSDTLLAEDALVLASDLNQASSTNWRFEFNLAKLIRDNPGTADFAFQIKGRSAHANAVSGAFSLKTRSAKMAMNGSEGTYMPNVIGGADVGSPVNFSAQVSNGADGNYNSDDLPLVISFNYNVPNSLLTYSLIQPPIEVAEFDYLAVRYHWEEGAGTDLDILVGYEKTGTEYDGRYVGYGQGNVIIPPSELDGSKGYLWWARDSTGTSGYEGVLVGMNKFLAAYPSLPEVVEVGLYAAWYASVRSGDFSLELITYKGGTMNIQGTDFVNIGGRKISSNLLMMNTKLRVDNSKLPYSYFKIGTLRYNKRTASAVISINEPT